MQLPRASEKVELGDGNAIEYVAAAATRKGSATAIVLFTIFVRREAKIAQIQIGHWSERTQHVEQFIRVDDRIVVDQYEPLQSGCFE